MSVDAIGASAMSVTGAIRQAAQKTGTSFEYLLATARVESNLNPAARAMSSSAGGLFQFLDQTWLATLKHAGPAFGYGAYADAISFTAEGRYEVRDPFLRQRILDLRSDPSTNALMAGAFTRWNGEWLASRLGRPPSEGELYLAHFLGAGGANRLISLAATAPQANASEVFPRAAGANRAIFYDSRGAPRSVAQVYDLVVGRFAAARARSPMTAPVASNQRAAPPAGAFLAKPSPPSTGARPPPAMLSPALPGAKVGDGTPVFHSLFHTNERREPLSPVVSSLWGAQAVSPVPRAGEADRSPSMLELFRDVRPLTNG